MSKEPCAGGGGIVGGGRGFAAVLLDASREVPAARVLSKPFHLRELVAAVQALFDEPALSESL